MLRLYVGVRLVHATEYKYLYILTSIQATSWPGVLEAGVCIPLFPFTTLPLTTQLPFADMCSRISTQPQLHNHDAADAESIMVWLMAGKERDKETIWLLPGVAVCNKHRLGRCSSLVGNKYNFSVGIAKPFNTTTRFLNIFSTKTSIICLDGMSYRASLTGQCRTQTLI
jgi:hypothetical protein